VDEKDDGGGHCALEDLPIFVRTFNGLRNSNLRTTEQICEKSPRELLKIRNFGVTSLTDLMDALAARGLSLSTHPHRVHNCPYCACRGAVR